MKFGEDIVKMKELIDFFGVSRRTVNLWMKNPDFPKPYKIGRTNVWERAEMDAYLAKLKKKTEISEDPEEKGNKQNG